MKKQYLDAEEKEIMEAIENDEFVPVTGVELRRVADAIAARKKDMTLTIRVNRNDINRKNDHIDCDIETLGLTDYKLKTIYNILSKSCLHNQGLLKRANATNCNINPHLIYRYLAAADWTKKYNGRRLVIFFYWS